MAEAFITRRGGGGKNYEYRYYTNTSQSLSVIDRTNDGFYAPNETYVIEYEMPLASNSSTKYYGFAMVTVPTSSSSNTGKIINFYQNLNTGLLRVSGGGDCTCGYGVYGDGSFHISASYNGTGNTNYTGAEIRIRKAVEEDYAWAKLG